MKQKPVLFVNLAITPVYHVMVLGLMNAHLVLTINKLTAMISHKVIMPGIYIIYHYMVILI